MNMKLASYISAATLLISIAVPLSAGAISSQTLLNQALIRYVNTPNNAFSGTYKQTETRKPLYPSLPTSSYEAEATFSITPDATNPRYLALDGTLTKLHVRDTEDNRDVQLPAPIGIQAINHEQLYLRFTNAGGYLNLITGTDTNSVTTTELLSQWLVDDFLNGTTSTALGLPTPDSHKLRSELELFRTTLKKAADKRLSPLTVVKTERVNGAPNTLRLHAKVNPAFVNFAEAEERKAAGTNRAERTAIQKQYKAVRASLNTLRLVVVLETQPQPTITRLEFSQTETETTKGCAYTRIDKQKQPVPASHRCNIAVYRKVTTMTGGINIAPKTTNIVPPANARSLKEAFTELFSTIIEAVIGTSFSSTDL